MSSRTLRKTFHSCGFFLLLECVFFIHVVSEIQCFKKVHSDAILTSHGYPSAFPVKVCNYDVSVVPRDTPAEYIAAIFDTLDINDGVKPPLKETNKIEIHDAFDVTLGTYTDKPPEGIIAKINKDRSKPSLKITFTSVHNKAKLKGFKMHFQLLTYNELVQNRSIRGDRGSAASPGYPFNYPNNFHEIYTVSTTNNNGVVRFRFEDVSLGEGSTLMFYDGTEIASTRLVYSFPDDREPKTNWNYFMSTNTITVYFKSGPKQTDRGFNMTFVEYCEYNNLESPCDEVPQLHFVKNLIIIGAGIGALVFIVATISLICFCTRKCKDRRRLNMGLQRFD